MHAANCFCNGTKTGGLVAGGDRAKDGRTESGAMLRWTHRNRFSQHIGANLQEERVAVRQSSRRNKLLNFHAVFLELLHDPAQAAGRTLEQCSKEVFRP